MQLCLKYNRKFYHYICWQIFPFFYTLYTFNF